MTALAGLEGASRWSGQHRWSELALFGVLGGWVPTSGPAPAKLVFDRHSQHAAWRAEQWWDRLPVLADVDRAALCVPPSAQVAELRDALGGLQDPVARMAGAYRVAMPRLFSSYECHRVETDAVGDSSSARTLAIVADDLAADWREGELALQQALRSGVEAVQTAAETVARLEAILVA